MKRPVAICLVISAITAGSLAQASDLWSSGMRLTGGQWSGAENAGVGKNVMLGISGEGIYPFTKQHVLACEAGYRTTLSQTLSNGSKAKTTGFFGGAYYRYRFDETQANGWLDGLYLQGGLRLNSMQSEREPGDSSSTVKGSRNTGIKPLIGVGFRFTDKISAGLDATTLSTNAPDSGAAKSGTLLEMSLGIHF